MMGKVACLLFVCYLALVNQCSGQYVEDDVIDSQPCVDPVTCSMNPTAECRLVTFDNGLGGTEQQERYYINNQRVFCWV